MCDLGESIALGMKELLKESNRVNKWNVKKY